MRLPCPISLAEARAPGRPYANAELPYARCLMQASRWNDTREEGVFARRVVFRVRNDYS
jgi:hypothetical protein